MTAGRGLFRRLTAVALAVALAALAAGCKQDAAREPGVVAVVNGAPIRLPDLEARYDLGRLGAPEAGNPAIGQLRAEYGAVLADMIVARLVRQELARLELAVTPAEVETAEARVRADYAAGDSGDAFGRMLLEERIDLGRWREILADRLALAKFSREVLRQNARVDVSEAAAYYKEHIDAFTRPARVRLAEVRGREAEAVQTALAVWRKSGQLASLQGLDGITVHEATIPEKNLAAPWREAVKSLKPGEASALLGADTETSFLVVLSREPATVLDPAKAYARVEAELAARKLEKTFAAWLAEALAGARITVNRQLLAGEGPEAAAVAQMRPQNGLALAREENHARDESVGQAENVLADRGGTGAGPAPSEPSAAPPAAPPSPEAAPDKAPALTPEPGRTDGPAAPPALGEAPVPPSASPPDADAVHPGGAGAVEFTAIKASWIRFAVDGGEEERVYLKPGQPHRIAFSRKLTVRLGSPSEVSYRAGGQETTVAVGKKESRILEFP
uniref:peptidylprolyl isomerase n=1 Tax=Desulfovibrio sp. U5L TaxID=596152 RepID=I2Q141_9BACT